MDHWDLVRAELAKQKAQRAAKKHTHPLAFLAGLLVCILIVAALIHLGDEGGGGSSTTTVDTHGYDGRVDNGVFTPERR